MTYLITYDLHNLRDYRPLYALMAQWKAVRLTESLWLGNLQGPAAEVRDTVLAWLDSDDTVAVVQLQPGSDWATMRANPAANSLLSSCVTRSQLAA